MTLKFKVIKKLPYSGLCHLFGKVGYVESLWGNTLWCKLPYVDGVCNKPDFGIKLKQDEIKKISTIEYYLRLAWQLITFKSVCEQPIG